MHLSPDLLTLLALGESAGSSHDEEHLAGCPVCTAELAELRSVVQLAKAADPDDRLVEPPPRVWEQIRAEIAAQAPNPPAAPLPTAGRTPRRALSFVLVAAVALVAGLGLGLGLDRVAEVRQASAAVTHLNALPTFPGAEGTARFGEDANGARTLVVEVDLPRSAAGPLEVWLSDELAEHMTSMGYLTDGRGTFPVPAGMDVADSPVLDVSLEPAADPQPDDHSGVSVVRGRMVR